MSDDVSQVKKDLVKNETEWLLNYRKINLAGSNLLGSKGTSCTDRAV